MALTPGTRLGVYEVTALLGEGGMGQVYRATDTRLKRQVAIKILPPSVAADHDRLARFQREAEVLASLNHPNIAGIYGLEESGGATALVMELVEGEDLSQRIVRGAIPIDEALPIAKQIAEALEAAHEQGIIHRDLKPANVKVREDGTVKILDFGLAKAMEPAGTAASSFLMRATITTPAMTQAGIILGTAAYMSPEQARGKTVDKRADIWAFGCVLYEMLTGEQLFRGETITDVLAAIVNSEPDLSEVSPRAQRLIRACLEKEARHRLQAIGDAWLLLESGAKTRQGGPHLSWGALLMALSVGILAIAAAGMWARWRQPVVARWPLQFQVNLPDGVRLVEGTSGGSALSPDGRTIAFVAMAGGVKRLWLRPFDSLPPRELTGTSGADFPFWSPDGRSIGFFADGKLKRVDSSGGQPIVLAEAPQGRGGAWASDGTILFGGSSGVLRRVSADTGPTTPVTKLDLANGENAHRWPQFLPGERRLLYFVRSSKPNRTGVYASSLDRPEDAVLVIANATNGLYSAPQDAAVGYLLWARENQIVAQMFDPERSRLSGETTVIAGTDGVGLSLNAHHASFSLSQEGTLLFAGAEDRFQLEWFGRNGQRAGAVGKPEGYAGLRISPDGRRVAVALYDSSATRDIWTMELARGLLNKVTTNGGGFVPIWSPDGHQIAYHDASQMRLTTVAADGSDRQTMMDSQGPVYINDWSPDGGSLLFTKASQTTLNDLWSFPLAGDRKPVPWLVTNYNESHGQYSPDGKWIAFTADNTGRQEVYICGFPCGERVRVSSTGGSFARWRGDGKELFYRSTDGRLMAVTVSSNEGRAAPGSSVALMDIVEPLGTFAYPYDISADGQRILTLKPVGSERRTAPLTVFVNWEADLKR